jgi:type IV secretion system protein TrbL
MDDLGVIDRFTNTFAQYIDSGFGLLGAEVAFLTSILVGIDIALAGLFWAMGGELDILGRFVRKVLYVGAFAFIINNFNLLAGIVFNSFAGLGLEATGAGLTYQEFLQPGRLASVGMEAGQPILEHVSTMLGFTGFFFHFLDIAVLLLAWLVVIVSFFVLAVQLFIAIIEFKLTTLAGFVLVPFALWNQTAFLAERVLGNVIASGIKILVLAVIVGIGTTLFGEFITSFGDEEPNLESALALVLASLSLFGLGIFGPGIASGLVSGAPQLGAGAAVGTAGAAAGGAIAGGVVATAGIKAATSGGLASVRAATNLGSAAKNAYSEGAVASGKSGVRAAAAGMTGIAQAGGAAISQRVKTAGARFVNGNAADTDLAGDGTSTATQGPAWARRLQRRARVQAGATAVSHAIRDGDRPSAGANPKLSSEG